MIKKLVSFLLLVSFLFSLSYAQTFSIFDNFDLLEKNLNDLELNSITKDILIDNLQKNLTQCQVDLENAKKLQTESENSRLKIQEQFETVSTLYEKSEQRLKSWRTVSIVSISVALASIITTVVLVNETVQIK